VQGGPKNKLLVAITETLSTAKCQSTFMIFGMHTLGL